MATQVFPYATVLHRMHIPIVLNEPALLTAEILTEAQHELYYYFIKEWGPRQLKKANIHNLFILKYESGIFSRTVIQHIHQGGH